MSEGPHPINPLPGLPAADRVAADRAAADHAARLTNAAMGGDDGASWSTPPPSAPTPSAPTPSAPTPSASSRTAPSHSIPPPPNDPHFSAASAFSRSGADNGGRPAFPEAAGLPVRGSDTLLSLPAPSDGSELTFEDRIRCCELRIGDLEAELTELRRDEGLSREGRSWWLWGPWVLVLLLLVVVGQLLVRLNPR